MRDPRKNSPVSDPTRLDALGKTELLDTPPEAYFDQVTRLVCKVVGTETALLSLVTNKRQFFKSSCGFTGPAALARETPLSHSLCQYVVESGQTFMLTDATKVPELADNRAIDELGVVSYLGVPVHAPNGEVIGSLCALSGEPRTWSDGDVGSLQDLAALVDEDLRLRAQSKRIVLLAHENAILAREYHHRVKNALAVSASLVKMSSRDAESVDDLVSKSTARLLALADAHNQLIDESDSVDLKELSSKLLLPYCRVGTTADVEGPTVTLTHKQLTPICYFLHELATNSAKYGAFKEDGRVTLRWKEAGETIELDWNEQLSDGLQRSPQGFGGRLIETAARLLGGTTHTTWSEVGLTVSLHFPQGQA